MKTPPEKPLATKARGVITDNDRILQAMGTLAEMFDASLSEIKTLGYLEALHGLPADALEAAAKRIAKYGKFFPRASEWREHAEAWLHEEERRRREEMIRRRGLARVTATAPEADVKVMLATLAKALGIDRPKVEHGDPEATALDNADA